MTGDASWPLEQAIDCVLPADNRNNEPTKGDKMRTMGLLQRWCVCAALASTALLGQIAGAMTFTLDNQSDIVIYQVYAGPDYDHWGSDLLGSGVLMPGSQQQFDLAAEPSHCMFDVRIHLSNGIVRQFMGLDFCESAYVTFEGDRRVLILNESSDTVIWSAHVSLVTEESWGEDRLGDNVIGAGDEYVVVLEDRYSSQCTFDIRLVTAQETSVEYRRWDLCADARVVFHEEKTLTVENEGEDEIYFVRASLDHETQEWGRDLISDNILWPGEGAVARFHEFAEDQCLIDVLVKEVDDEEHVYEDVDICTDGRLVHPRGPDALDDGDEGVSRPSVVQVQRDDLSVGETFRDCDDWRCPWMVVVDGGAFERGSWDRDEETPVTNVTVSGPFAVGQFEVSVGQFEEFADATDHDGGNRCYVKQGSRWRWTDGLSWRNPGFDQDDSHPVVCVNWDDAIAYTNWLTERTGAQYRLLTETEAELLARASAMSFERSGRANCRSCGSQWDGKSTSPVGRMRPNRLGLSGVFGNAAEWVQDCYQSSYSNAPRDGSAWSPASCEQRAIRGGCWFTKAQKLRASGRDYGKSNRRSSCVGFRVARSIVQ